MINFNSIINTYKINKNDIFIDCGANVGNITDYFLNFSDNVHCFEPNPYAYQILQKRFANNKNVKLINAPVSVKKEKILLYYHENSDIDEVKFSTGMSACKDKNNVSENKFIELDAINISQYIKDILDKGNSIGILKIDIEGLEGKVLKNLIENNLTNKIKYILCETHEKKVPSCRDDVDFVRKYIKLNNIKNINLDWI